MTPIENLRRATEKIFETDFRFQPDPDTALTNRYAESFENIWLDEASQLEAHRALVRSAQTAAISEHAYRKTFQRTDNPELSALVSDDFDLFCTATLIGHSTPFLCGLWKSYSLGLFPTEPNFEKAILQELITAYRTGK